jgi:diguanylate cyclase (GGDEF)-like protein/PAS domain S-box-containing protein
MAETRNLLLIDKNPAHAELFRAALLNTNEGPFHDEWVQTLSQAVERLREKPIWAIFANTSLPDSQGLDTIDQLIQAAPGVPILVLAGAEHEDLCTEALRRGAKDYLLEGHIDAYSFGRAIRNMAERETAEQVLFVEKERASVTLNSIGDAVISTDICGNVTYLNVVAEGMTGWSRNDAPGRPFSEVFRIIDGVTHQPARNPMELAIQQNKTVGLTPNCILIRLDGFEIAIEDSAAPIHDRQNRVTGAVIVFHDVSAARAMALQMSHLAQHDVLTDLPNRMMLTDRVDQAISLARRNRGSLAILFLDLDNFKNINDSLGHSAGDRLLQSVATRLSACIRHSDTVGRLGGDEFVILLTEVKHPADAAISARKILAALMRPYRVSEHDLTVTASIGLSTYPADGQDADTLIRNADAAMYWAKESGRNNYRFFDSGEDFPADNWISIEAGLRMALEREEFVLHYQPKVNLQTGAITGAEALLRWRHPVRGLIPPLEFVPIAEGCGLILSIGRWVLREACRQARAWQDAGLPPISVAVNVSSLEFRSKYFIQHVSSILSETRLDSRYLELELTESVLMQHASTSASALGALKSIGVSLAADDFGTGYSSLSYLKMFPIDCLKIDQSFVHDITTETDDATIVTAMIAMAKGLHKQIIAEGVETREQMAFLQAHGCDQAQGYYFSRPLIAQEFAKLLETGVAPFAPPICVAVPA